MKNLSNKIYHYIHNAPVTFTILCTITSLHLLGEISLQLLETNYIYEFFYANKKVTFDNFQIWRLLSFNFIHSNFAHFISNFLALAYFSYWLERILGKKEFKKIIAFSTIIGSVFTTLMHDSYIIENNILVLNKIAGSSLIGYGVLGSLLYISLFKPSLTNRKFSIVVIIAITMGLISTFSIEEFSVYGHMSGLILGILFTYLFLKYNKNVLN